MMQSRRRWSLCLLFLLSSAAVARPEPTIPHPPYKGHDLPRLRGAMISTRVTQDDLRILGGQWKANLIRWQLTWGGFPRSPADTADLIAYEKWLNSALDQLNAMLPLCDELGIKVVVDLHTPPGGRDPASSACRLFAVKEFQEAFARLWKQMARRYQGNRVIWGYDLVNEPVEGKVAEGLMDWQALAAHTAQKVRAIDPDHAIIIEPAPWGSSQSLQRFTPLDVPGVLYSVHMYLPHGFTHQGVRGSPTDVSYPGKVGREYWDKEKLRATLQPVVEYQREHNVHIYIGEFSAIRWAPGQSACNYLRDLIDIFEKHGWDWTYHAFREWDGWSVEHGPDRNDHQPATTPTDRQRLLMSWYANNQRAARVMARPEDAGAKRVSLLYISGTMHFETNRLSWPDPDRLLAFLRRALAAGKAPGRDSGMRWSIGADIGWLEGAPRAGEIIRATESLGIEWDVHAHHMPDRANCAAAIRRLGGHPNQVASGLLTTELDELRNPVQGRDGATWQAEILWGAALRPLHGPGADDNAFGLWRPKSGREHTLHDPAGNLIIVGGGTRRLEDLERFAEELAASPNSLPVSSATIIVSPRMMTVVGTQDGIEAIEGWAQRVGKLPMVRFATIRETAAAWVAGGSVPSRDTRLKGN